MRGWLAGCPIVLMTPAKAVESTKLAKMMPAGNGVLRVAICAGTTGACRRASRASELAEVLKEAFDDFSKESSEPSEGSDLNMYMKLYKVLLFYGFLELSSI